MNIELVRVKGVKFQLGDKTLILPPLSLRAFDQLLPRINAFMANKESPDDTMVVVEAVHAALKRNYPDVTLEEVGDAVGLENMAEVLEAVMDVSGAVRKKREAAEAEGEATPS